MQTAYNKCTVPKESGFMKARRDTKVCLVFKCFLNRSEFSVGK